MDDVVLFLTIFLIIGKLTGDITCSWFLVFSPILIYILIVVFIIFGVAIISCITK